MGLEQVKVKCLLALDKIDTIDGFGDAEYMILPTILTSIPRTEQHSITSDQCSRLEDRTDMGFISPVFEYGACHHGGRADIEFISD